LAAQAANRLAVDRKVVAGVRRTLRQVGQHVHQFGDAGDRLLAIEWRARPGASEVAPLDQLAAGTAQTLDRAVLIHVAGAERSARPPQRTTDPFRGILQLLLEPRIERFGEQPLCLALGEDAE